MSAEACVWGCGAPVHKTGPGPGDRLHVAEKANPKQLAAIVCERTSGSMADCIAEVAVARSGLPTG